jgi:protein gp37
MADLFGDWVPNEWIETVFDSCRKAPWHRYLFLTKNPKRYYDLALEDKLLEGDNIWFGSSVTTPEDKFMNTVDPSRNAFLSVEPMLADFGNWPAIKDGGVKWVILGAETGRNEGKIIPERSWIQNAADACREAGIPLFMKNSVAPIWNAALITEKPWEGK